MCVTTLLDTDVKKTPPQPDFELLRLSAVLPCSVDRTHPDLSHRLRSSEMGCDAQFPSPSITPVF